LKGGPGGTAPNLIIAGAYNRDQFIHFLKTGEGELGRKDLGLMSLIAKNHLLLLTLVLILNNYGYDFQVSSKDEIEKDLQAPRMSKILGNYIELLKKYKLNSIAEIKFLETLGADFR